MLDTSKELIDSFATSLRRTNWKTKTNSHQFDYSLDFTVEDAIEKFFSVETFISGNRLYMRQPSSIDRIIDVDVFSSKPMGSKTTLYTNTLHKDESGEERKDSWNYHSLIGTLKYLANATRLDMIISAHQYS